MVAKKKRSSEPSHSQRTLDQFEKQSFLEKLTPIQIKIIQLIHEGMYQAAIARQLGYSRSYICRFIKQLQKHELITLEWKNPLTQRAISYRITKELEEVLSRLETPIVKEAFTLCAPHKIRYNRKILTINKPIPTNISRFAAAKFKHIKSWEAKGGERHLFEMKHERVGRIGIIVHPLRSGLYSIEYYQAYRKHIPAKDIFDATIQLSMALEEATSRFQQELGWCGVDITYGKPALVGSPHYTFVSKFARALTDAGQTKLQFSDGAEIDKSLEDKFREKNVAEIEYGVEEVADIVDRGLQNAANIDKIVPPLVAQTLATTIPQYMAEFSKTLAAQISPLKENIDSMSAHILAGSTTQFKLNEQNQMILKLMNENWDLRKRIEKLEKNEV